jgi:hypothetical protein
MTLESTQVADDGGIWLRYRLQGSRWPPASLRPVSLDNPAAGDSAIALARQYRAGIGQIISSSRICVARL